MPHPEGPTADHSSSPGVRTAIWQSSRVNRSEKRREISPAELHGLPRRVREVCCRCRDAKPRVHEHAIDVRIGGLQSKHHQRKGRVRERKRERVCVCVREREKERERDREREKERERERERE
jgi:hypothetical protein